jgi:hypothetical protein
MRQYQLMGLHHKAILQQRNHRHIFKALPHCYKLYCLSSKYLPRPIEVLALRDPPRSLRERKESLDYFSIGAWDIRFPVNGSTQQARSLNRPATQRLRFWEPYLNVHITGELSEAACVRRGPADNLKL